jgi:hypothetical protein
MGFDSIKAGKHLAEFPHPLVPSFFDLLVGTGKANHREAIGGWGCAPENVGEWINVIKVESLDGFHTWFCQLVFPNLDEPADNGFRVPSNAGDEDLPHSSYFKAHGATRLRCGFEGSDVLAITRLSITLESLFRSWSHREYNRLSGDHGEPNTVGHAGEDELTSCRTWDIGCQSSSISTAHSLPSIQRTIGFGSFVAPLVKRQ